MEENETLEFKRSTSELKEAIISIVAILNKHQNGRLIFGVRNDGIVIGQHITENKLILEKNKEKLRWDSEVCKEAKLTDISSKRLKWFLKEAGHEYHSAKNSLDKLGLLKAGKLLNAAVILFGKKPQQFFSNAKLRCAAFATTTTSLIVDRQEFEGDLFYLIEKAEEYILKNIHIGMRLEGMRRIDVPEIDKDAFREAIINAFCHRDYYEHDSVNIAVFKDRLEVRSPGGLYGGLTIEQIKKKMVSRRRNEEIADMFHEVHFVEKWGRGISLILSKEPDADFEEVANIFITKFKRKHVEKVTENQASILDEITKNNRITTEELSKIVGISKRKIKENIAKLKKKGILKRIGPAKGGHWEVKG